MSRDRMITWPRSKGPSREDVGKVVEDYACGLGEVRWDQDRWLISLPGSGNSALRRVSKHARPSGGERWIEVWIDQDQRKRGCVDVMTRQQDDITNDIADGLAGIIAHFWNGEREP